MQAVDSILQLDAATETQDPFESEPDDSTEDVVESKSSHDGGIEQVGMVNTRSGHGEETEHASAANVLVADTSTDRLPATCNCCRHCHPPHLEPIEHPTVQPHPLGPRSSTPILPCSPAAFLPPSSCAVDQTTVLSHPSTPTPPTPVRAMSFPPVTFFPHPSRVFPENDLMTSFGSMLADESHECFESYDDSADPSFRMGADSTSSCSDEHDDQQEPADPVSDRKFIVFEGQLDKLLKHCPDCGAPVEEADRKVTGSLLSVKTQCMNGHNVIWDSQPTFGRGMVKTGYGNLLLAAAILFSGGIYSTFSLWASLLNLAFFGKSTFFKIQRDILCPVINLAWSLQVDAMHFLCQGQQMKVIGDARCDSPGYSAKYGMCWQKLVRCAPFLNMISILKSSCETKWHSIM